MRTVSIRQLLAASLAGAAILFAAADPVHTQPRRSLVAATSADGLRVWDDTVTRMARRGDLRLQRTVSDPLLPGRTHERYAQSFEGVPVYGADMTRQTSNGLTVSVFGTMYSGIDLDTTAALGVDEAAAIVARESGVTLGPARLPQLLVYPLDGGYRLAYRATAFTPAGGTEFFIDANTGAIVARLDAVQRQTAIGRGAGVLGDEKKMSVTPLGGAFIAEDGLRPPGLLTFDMKGNIIRTIGFLNGFGFLGVSDLGASSNNAWADPAIVDAHAYSGYVYDYFYRRFGRRSVDNQDLTLINVVHPVSRDDYASQDPLVQGAFYLNASYYGDGIMVYGEGAPSDVTVRGQQWNYLSGALDVVGHELTHGVTDYSSGLIYSGESGALNESFSDMMGTAVEFFYQPPGGGLLHADYLCGEDVITPGGIRSLANPAAYGQPDHYSRRLLAPPEVDNGGVHTNSGIPNQVYYLAIEGGVNRTSGQSVEGVGPANREQIEKVMYRAFTELMPASATFAVARAATIQAARDLYGAGSNAERAVAQAWEAVGIS
jgi:Zn-dependent metalloprotease